MEKPARAASSEKAASNSAAEISLRSNRAQALRSGSVALIRRMVSGGTPIRASSRLKASNGLVRMTPPKSQSTAEIVVEPVTARS
jgi:hypothetical protein